MLHALAGTANASNPLQVRRCCIEGWTGGDIEAARRLTHHHANEKALIFQVDQAADARRAPFAAWAAAALLAGAGAAAALPAAQCEAEHCGGSVSARHLHGTL